MQFGPWDLVIRYLFPGVWIIPVIASIFAWIGAVQFWRKWGPKLLARSAKAMPVVGGALASLPARMNRIPLPPRPRLVLRYFVAAPFFAVWSAGFVIWYLIGSIPNSAGIGREGLVLTPTTLSVILGGYGFIAMCVATGLIVDSEDLGCTGPLVVSVLVALPAMALAMLRLIVELLTNLAPLRLRLDWGEWVFVLIIPMSFLPPVLAFQGGWAIVRNKKRG